MDISPFELRFVSVEHYVIVFGSIDMGFKNYNLLSMGDIVCIMSRPQASEHDYAGGRVVSVLTRFGKGFMHAIHVFDSTKEMQ